MFRGVEYDAPVARYYERLAAVQARGSQASHQVLRDILREVHIHVPFILFLDNFMANPLFDGLTSNVFVYYGIKKLI